MNATQTNLTTHDSLTVYDLAPQAAELVAVAGPAGYDPATIDQDSLPDGFRWVGAREWESLQAGEDEIDLTKLRGEYLGSYGRRGGMGPTVEVYAMPLHADEVRRLWDKLDAVDDVTAEDRIFARLEKLGALAGE